MKNFRYLKNVSTLKLDQSKCTGCKICTNVCPHNIFTIENKKASIQDHDGCMECGACALNCPVEAVTVSPGVGCADYIIQSWIFGPENATCGSGKCC